MNQTYLLVCWQSDIRVGFRGVIIIAMLKCLPTKNVVVFHFMAR